METSVKLYSLPFGNVKTYLFVLLFVAGNIALPQLCHLVPAGGPTLLPIYFFTLIAAYKYGFKVGLLTALLSPVINHLLFAMPAAAVLPAILIKSGLLAGTAALAARYAKNISLLALLGVVLSYQIIGTVFEWALCGNFFLAVQDFRMGIYNPQIQISVVSGTKRSIFRQKNKTKRSKKRLHTTLIKPEQKVNEDLCSGFIVS